MQQVGDQVKQLAEALRTTMDEGDHRLPTNSAEQKILQALVAETAVDVANWVGSRAPNGEVAAEPLTKLASRLAKGNIVGQGLASVQKALVKQAQSVALWAVGLGTLPVWLGGIVAIIIGAAGASQEAGTALGKVAIGTLLGGGAAGYALLRALGASGGLARSAGGAAGSLWMSAGSIGSQAEAIVLEQAGPALAELQPLGYSRGMSRSVVIKLRGSAKFIVGASYFFLAVCILYFIFGVLHAWDAYQACLGPVPSTTCPSK
jgi:hypothetical protein